MIKDEGGIVFLVSHNANRDEIIKAAGLRIKAVHKCYLSDKSIIINSLRTSYDGTLMQAIKSSVGARALKEAKERITSKNKALLLRKFQRNTKFTDERMRQTSVINENDPQSFRKQDHCWVYVL
jgi:hypothetical protein